MNPCEGCIRSKSHKASIKKTHTTETQPKEELDVVVSDLKSMSCEGTGRAKTVGSAIDKKSRYTTSTLVFLHTKDQWYLKYEAILRWFKNQKGRIFKIWRTVGGGEFCNDNIDAINKREGIEQSITPPHTPNKNSTAERFWRTMIEAIGAMLIHASMSPSWWVEAATYFVYMKNRTPHKGLNWKTPYEEFYKKAPHTLDFKVFACLAYAHIEFANRSKKILDKAIACMFLGIDPSGRYILATYINKKIIFTDSAEFIQNIFPEGRHKHLMHLDLQTILRTLNSVPTSGKMEPPVKIDYVTSCSQPPLVENLKTLSTNQNPVKPGSQPELTSEDGVEVDEDTDDEDVGTVQEETKENVLPTTPKDSHAVKSNNLMPSLERKEDIPKDDVYVHTSQHTNTR